MQQIIPIVAFTIMTIGLITLIIALKELTTMLEESTKAGSYATPHSEGAGGVPEPKLGAAEKPAHGSSA